MSCSVDLSPFLIKIWDATVAELKHLRRPEPGIEELKKAKAGLEAKADDINNSISLAQLEGEIPTNEVQLWLRDVNELQGKAAATEQDFESRRCLGGWSWNCFSVNRRVAKRMDEIDKLKRLDATSVATKPPPPAVVQIPTSNSMISMEAYKSQILDHIARTNAGVIGVYGMGGVGKTTLLKSINNHKDVAKFDQVIWVVASRECTMARLQMNIAKRLKLKMNEDDSEEDRAAKLFNFLKNKDCLLLLDDLWDSLDLAMLGMVHGLSGQEVQKRKVVVFTTRDEQVCSGMMASKKMKIKCLEQKQAWELFRRNAGEEAIGSDHGIKHIALQIAEECAGLPLALVTVGMAMSTKKSYEAWKDALTQMRNSQMPKVTDVKKPDPMFSAFKLSYDSLEDDDMRGRLLSCAMWPEDFSINKDKLIECWMGLGLITGVGAIHEAYNRGHSHINTLQAVCLLEPGNEEWEVTMHDVIRDMTLSMNRFKWIVRTGGATSQGLEEEAWHKAERVSMWDDFESLPDQLSVCSKLSVLMLQGNRKLKKIHGSFLQAMHALTYLDLEDSAIERIPKEISMLSQLRHLNLSWTPITELPAELGCLVKLNQLLLRNTPNLMVVGKGAISNLLSLQLLDLKGSGYEDCWDELESSKGCQKSICIDITTAAALCRLCRLPHVSTWRLNVTSLMDSTNPSELLDDIIRNRNISQSLEQLIINEVKMDELLISKGHKQVGAFECLKYLLLSYLSELEEITWKGVQPQIVFPSLRMLNIYKCSSLRNVNWTLQLPSLSVLDISDCETMEELISDEGNSGTSSFGLRSMMLTRLPKLRSISPRAVYFEYLEEINVQQCPILMELPFENQISENNRLKVIQCEETWWDNLKWEDESIKHSLAPLVQRSKQSWECWLSTIYFLS